MGKGICGEYKNTELGDNITQQMDGLFLVRFGAHGDAHFFQTRTHSLEEAQRIQRDIALERTQGIFRKSPSETDGLAGGTDSAGNDAVTLDTFVVGWLPDYTGIRDTTRTNIERHYRLYIKPVLGDMALRDITKSDCEKVFRHMERKGLALGTIKDVKSTMSTIFEEAVDRDYLGKSPAKRIRVMSNFLPDEEKVKHYAPDEVECLVRFLNEARVPPYLGPCITLLFETGLRISEMTGLRLSDIDWQSNELHVQRILMYQYDREPGEAKGRCVWRYGDLKSRAGRRIIPLSTKAREALQALIAQSDRVRHKSLEQFRQLVVLNGNGKPVSAPNFDTALSRACEKAGLPHISAHRCRHTFATLSCNGGAQIGNLAEVMGHRSTSTTQDYYIHSSRKGLHDVIKHHDSAMNPPPDKPRRKRRGAAEP